MGIKDTIYMMQKDIEYIYSLKKYLVLIIVVFLISVFWGLIAAIAYPEESARLIESFRNRFGWITVLDPFDRMLAIFRNNALDSLLALLLGIGFGIVPFFIIASNGFFLGMITFVYAEKAGIFFVLASILPHGIIELPMIFLSAAIGIRLGHEFLKWLRGSRSGLAAEIMRGIKFYIRIIFPLLFIAAVIESYITPMIALEFMP